MSRSRGPVHAAAVAFLALGLVLTSCTADPVGPTAAPDPRAAPARSPARAPVPITVRVGVNHAPADYGIYGAIEKGYFEEQGIEVELVDFGTVTDLVALLGSGHVDVATGVIGTSIYNRILRGLDVKWVADKGSISPDSRSGFESALVWVTAKGTALGDYRDFKAKKIGIVGRGTPGHLLLQRALGRGGLTEGDVTINQLPFGDMPAALASGSIDIALASEPTATLGEDAGALIRWRNAYDLYPGAPLGGIFFGPSLGRLAPDAGGRFMVAYLRAVRDWNDAFGPRKKDRSDVIGILGRYTAVKDPTVYDRVSFDYLSPGCHIDRALAQADLEWYGRHGLLQPGTPDLSRINDRTYCDFALAQLGPYR